MSHARWSVERRPWKQFGADLPDEVRALVAPPVVVSAEPQEDDEEEHYPAPDTPCACVPVQVWDGAAPATLVAPGLATVPV